MFPHTRSTTVYCLRTKSGDSLDCSQYPNITGPSDCVSLSLEEIGVTTLTTVVSEVMCSEDPWWQLISPVSPQSVSCLERRILRCLGKVNQSGGQCSADSSRPLITGNPPEGASVVLAPLALKDMQIQLNC